MLEGGEERRASSEASTVSLSFRFAGVSFR